MCSLGCVSLYRNHLKKILKETEDDKIEGMSQYPSSGVVFEVIE